MNCDLDATSLGAVGEARWTYAVSKLATEHLAHNYFKQFGIPSVAIRPFNIFGPGQVGEGAIPRLIMQALRGQDITIHNDGRQIRAWCFIDDIVDGILRTLTRPEAVGLVIMAYDECATLESVAADSLTTFADAEIEILIVDDGSSDGTGEVADSLAGRYPQVRVIHHPANQGGRRLPHGVPRSTRRGPDVPACRWTVSAFDRAPVSR